MKQQRTDRLGGEIQSILGELLVRGDVKDPRVRDAGLITITRVRVTGDLREARVAFAVFGAGAEALARVRAGLASASGHLQRAIGQRLRLRHTPTLRFEVDTALDSAFHVDAILRQVGADAATEAAAAAASGEEPNAGGEGAADDGADADADADAGAAATDASASDVGDGSATDEKG